MSMSKVFDTVLTQLLAIFSYMALEKKRELYFEFNHKSSDDVVRHSNTM